MEEGREARLERAERVWRHLLERREVCPQWLEETHNVSCLRGRAAHVELEASDRAEVRAACELEDAQHLAHARRGELRPDRRQVGRAYTPELELVKRLVQWHRRRHTRNHGGARWRRLRVGLKRSLDLACPRGDDRFAREHVLFVARRALGRRRHRRRRRQRQQRAALRCAERHADERCESREALEQVAHHECGPTALVFWAQEQRQVRCFAQPVHLAECVWQKVTWHHDLLNIVGSYRMPV